MSERRAYRLTGRVQGVGFRWWTRNTARDLGLRGTVRNDPDGSVEVDVAGEAEPLARFEEALQDGPPHAQVRALERIEPAGDLPDGFEIVR